MLQTKKISVLAALIAAFFMVFSSPAQAVGIINTENPNVLVDEFDEPFAVPNPNLPWDYWYKMMISADEQGFWRRENLTQNVDCSVDVCVTQMTESGRGFARLSISPFQFPNDHHVSIAQISDQRDSFSYELPHRWQPTPGHPIEYKVVFRASDAYKADASGTAVGNWGIALFNYADYFADPNANVERENGSFSRHADDYQVLSFTWFDSGNVYGLLPGFYAASTNKLGSVPMHITPIRNVNINDWTEAKIRWETNILNLQLAKFYINGQLVSLFVPPFGMPPLGVFIYNDNERFVLTEEGLRPSHVEIPATQYLDIDKVDIRKL